MGTIAARDCQRVLTLSEQVLAAGILSAWQGVQLRLNAGELSQANLQPAMQECLLRTGEIFELLREDRALESDLRNTVAHILNRYWVLYD